MFTGLIEKVGTLKSAQIIQGGNTFTVAHDPWKEPLKPGESIAVNGICFTVTSAVASAFTFDALDETIGRTNIRTRKPGAPLNIERALRIGDSVGGHFVSGHVDGVASLVSVRTAGRDKVLKLECSAELIEGMVIKGSVACDGVSLTISGLSTNSFEVNVIPFTLANTSLRYSTEGDILNIETDMLGKYIYRYTQKGKSSGSLDFDKLRDTGFIIEEHP